MAHQQLRWLLGAGLWCRGTTPATHHWLSHGQPALELVAAAWPPSRHHRPQEACCSLSTAAAAAARSTQPGSSGPTPPPPAAADRQQRQQQGQEGVGDAAAVQALAQQYQRSRMQQFYADHLARELLLKLDVSSIEQLPRVTSLHLAISAKDMHGQRYAEKWQMLLPALALEYISGRPASFVTSSLKYYRAKNAVTAVKVALRGPAAFDVLQKLAYVVLPSQNAFGGIPSRSFDAAGNLHFRVPRMVNFPDFEEQFEIFENLAGLHVSINMADSSGGRVRSRRQRQRNTLLLTGLQLPILPPKRTLEGGDAAAAADGGAAAAAAAGEAGDADEGDDDASGGAGLSSSSSSSDDEA